MQTNNASFKPQPHDPRWKNARTNPPGTDDYPIWVDAIDYAREHGMNPPHCISLQPAESEGTWSKGMWSMSTLWISDKEARSPIPCDAYPPVFPAYIFCPGYKPWGWICVRDTFDPYENDWVARATHWFPLEEGKRASLVEGQPRLPRFPTGEPPAGYRWLGEGETVKEGDQYFSRDLRQVVKGLVGFKVGTFDCDYDALPYFRPLDKPAAPPIAECRGSSDDLPPPAGLAALEDSLDELHDKIDSVSDGLGGDFTNAFERLAAVERKLDRLLSHLGAHKPEVRTEA